MPPPRRVINARLDAIYGELPAIECRGLCADECTAIVMTPAERQRIRIASGIRIPDTIIDDPDGAEGQAYREYLSLARARAPEHVVDEGYQCPALTGGRCAVYDVRPLICRAWGLTRGMQCRYGCQPSRWLSEEESTDIYRRIWEAGGVPEIVTRLHGAAFIPDTAPEEA